MAKLPPTLFLFLPIAMLAVGWLLRRLRLTRAVLIMLPITLAFVALDVAQDWDERILPSFRYSQYGPLNDGVRTAWAGLALFAGMMGWAATRIVATVRRDIRFNQGLCLQCGYDLRGSGERCPECGEANAARERAD